MPVLSRDRLVVRLNEVFHDAEGRAYDGKHPDITEAETGRWRRLASAWLAGDRPPLRILDIGSGTGFVPLQLLGHLRADDTLTCADLSAAMLEACGSNLKAAGLPCAFHPLKLDGGGIPLPDASQDRVTVNAVLHHLADPGALCREIDRVLKPGGRVAIGHEPNRSHHHRLVLTLAYWCLLPFADFKLFGYEILLRLGLFDPLRGWLGRWIPELGRHNDLIREVNDRLMRAGDIAAPLAAEEMSALLDIQSPTAGGPHEGRGFAREDFARYFPGWAMERFRTYRHLNKIHPRTRWLRACEARLAGWYPRDGACLACELVKPAVRS